MARCGDCAPAILGLEGRGSCVASSRRSRPLVSAGATRWAEVMTPRGVRALSRPAVTLEWSAWVVTRGRVSDHEHDGVARVPVGTINHFLYQRREIWSPLPH